jgi:hypothetical protein
MRTRTIIRSFLTTVVIIGTSAALAKDKASDSFLKKAIEGNYAEVKMGELAHVPSGLRLEFGVAHSPVT